MTASQHAQCNFFIADILDATPKVDLASMEHPIFSLKAGDKRVRTYEHNGFTVTVKPGHDGCATIHDKDIWIYCISQLVEALNRSRDVSDVVRFTAYDFLMVTNRDTSGRAYKRMGEALGRLKGTVIETNIKTGGQCERAGFGLIDSWRVIGGDHDNRMLAIEVTLPNWLLRSVRARHVLTLSRYYFELRKPLDRRIYELARKHCGRQPRWRVGIVTLHEKSGSVSTLREFRRLVKGLDGSNKLPDYRLAFDPDSDAVTFYSRDEKGRTAQLADIMNGFKKQGHRCG